jgi:DNA-binding NarL/FixJ family response regulator
VSGTPLSPREREVLALLAGGVSSTDIAEQLGITPATFKVHLTHIFQKTGAANRVQAARYYLDNLQHDHAAENAVELGGGSAITRDDENATRGDLGPGAPPRGARLSRRELQVLERVSVGAPSDEIARELGVVQATIKTYLRSIYKKTGSQNRIQAARYYLRHYGTADAVQFSNLEDDIADIKARLYELQPAVEEAQRLQDALETRLHELQPAVEEAQRLRHALEALQAARSAFKG